MYPKIDVMERECKKLEFGGDLSKALVSRTCTKSCSFHNVCLRVKVNHAKS
jgi:hypothetical protein